MMSYIRRWIFLITALLSLIALSCKDKWDDHYSSHDPMLAETLLSEIKKNPQLSKFSEYIHTTGYDTILAVSKAFTIWAPTNDALAGLDPSIIADPDKLRLFVGNHIAYQSYFTSMATSPLQIPTLNKKNVIFTARSIDDIVISVANIYVGNGVLHIIEGAVIPKQNIYEFLGSSDIAPKQLNHIKSFDIKIYDPSQGEVIGIDPDTGKPIYKEGTDSIIRNAYLRNSAQIDKEDSLFTYVVLKDIAFTEEENKLLPYFKALNQKGEYNEDSSRVIARNHLVKNLAFKGLYLPNNLPDSLMSVGGVKVHLDPSAIVETHRLSNGIVYVMDNIAYKTSKFLGEIIIEGENVTSFSNPNPPEDRTYTRRNPDGLSNYTQQRSTNITRARSWYGYTALLNSVRYKVYWRAIRDFNLVPPSPVPPSTEKPPLTLWQQRIAFKSFDATELPYKYVQAQEVLPVPTVGPRKYVPDYDEEYIGEYTVDRYGVESIFLVSDVQAIAGLNNLVLDYIRLVPVTN